VTYKIESRQKNVAGVGGHNYLALVGENGIVRREIHGHIGQNNRLVFEKGILNPEVEGAAREVISGTKDEVTRIWSRMEDDARDLGGDPDVPGSHENAKAVYGLLSPNSNSFRATILGRAGFGHRDFHPNSPNWTPGTGIDLNNPVWWAPEIRWPGTIPTSPDHLDRPLASQTQPQPVRGLLSLMDDEDTPAARAFGLLSYMDQQNADEVSGSPLHFDTYDRHRVFAPHLVGWR
jgi:hypothetical protein